MKKDFLTKTLSDATRVLEYSIFANSYAEKNGLLQNLDPRVKLLTSLVFLIITGLSRTLTLLVALYILVFILAVFSKIPPFFFIKRVWVFIPIFTSLIVLPAMFNIITPGKPILTIVTLSRPHSFGPFYIPETIAITSQGLSGAMILVMRVATSVSIAVLLILTTKWISLLKALSVLKIPEIAILILAMTYRYIHLFLRTVEGMLLARQSRQISSSKMRETHGWIASRIGVLVGKSYNLSNDVHLAMISRGWSGNPKLIGNFSIHLIDFIWIGFTLGIVILWIISR